MGLSIDIATEHEAWSSLAGVEATVARAANAAVAAVGVGFASDPELSVVLCDDAFIRNLNKTWRGKDKATDVLSFPADPSVRHATLGDVVVAYETSAADAERDGRPLGDHLAHLVVHGTLHLLGYDHETTQEALAMEALEGLALRDLGIASPYEDAALLGADP